MQHFLIPGAVQRQRDAVMARELDQPGQDVVVAVGADQHIGVVVFEQVSHGEQQLSPLCAWEMKGMSINLHQQVAAMAAAWVPHLARQIYGHDAQRWQTVIDLPGCVERLDALDATILVFNITVGQRENAPR